jgi:hypothetical protein
MPHSLTPYLSRTIVDDAGIPVSTILSSLPPGWEQKFYTVLMELDDILELCIVKLDIRNGVLYITPSEDGKYRQLMTLATRALSQESARVCMVCGEYGMRRKEQEHKPCLCRTHYLDFINYVEE